MIAGGACFVVPATLMVMVLAWVYVKYGSTPEAGWLLYGIKTVVIAIIAQALASLGRKAVKRALYHGHRARRSRSVLSRRQRNRTALLRRTRRHGRRETSGGLENAKRVFFPRAAGRPER